MIPRDLLAREKSHEALLFMELFHIINEYVTQSLNILSGVVAQRSGEI